MGSIIRNTHYMPFLRPLQRPEERSGGTRPDVRRGRPLFIQEKPLQGETRLMECPSPLCVDIQEGEYWYGGCVSDGTRMPLGRDAAFERSLVINETANQAAPLLVSSHGRYIWCREGFRYRFQRGTLRVEAPGSPPVSVRGRRHAARRDPAGRPGAFRPGRRAARPVFHRAPVQHVDRAAVSPESAGYPRLRAAYPRERAAGGRADDRLRLGGL